MERPARRSTWAPAEAVDRLRDRWRGTPRRLAVEAERRWDAARLARRASRRPEHLRIATYLGHGSGGRVVVRGRVLDDPEPPPAIEGEGVVAAVRRTIARFTTDELPGVPLRVRVGDAEVETTSDREGYFDLRVDVGAADLPGTWASGAVEVAGPYRGISLPHPTPVHIRLSGPGARFGVISDVDDTILRTGAQRLGEMVRVTVTGSALTRSPFPGAAELYRALAADDANPVFYVSSSPWNLHDFLTAFLRRRDFPLGPLLLRDLLGDGAHRSHATTKLASIDEVLSLHPDLRFVLIGDSGQHDPEIYAEVVRANPLRVVAVLIREVRLDPGDGRVESVSDAWDHDVPFVLAADSATLGEHAAGLGLITAEEAAVVARAADGPGPHGGAPEAPRPRP